MPSTPAEMAEYFRKSPAYARLQEDMTAYKVTLKKNHLINSEFLIIAPQNRHASSHDADEFRAGVKSSKQPLTGRTNAYKVRIPGLERAEKMVFILRSIP